MRLNALHGLYLMQTPEMEKNVLCNCMWLCEENRYNFKTSAADWPKELQIKDFLFTYVDKSSNSAGKCKC